MDVVPAFLAIDGAKFPLVVGSGHVAIGDDKRFPGLDALSYVAGHLIARQGGDRVAEITRRDSLNHQALTAFFVGAADRDDLGDGVANWVRLAGYPPDLDDAYFVGTTWIRQALVVPRRTLISLVEQVGALNDAVLAHQLEPRIEGTPEAGPVDPAPVTEGEDWDDATDDAPDDATDDGSADAAGAPGAAASASGAAGAAPVSASVSTARAPTRIATDDLLRDIEALAAQVDELDAAARQGDVPYANVERSAAAAAKRHRLFIELDVAGLFAPALADPARATLTRLGLTRLLGYVEAAWALAAYLASPERAARFPGQAVPALTAAAVSLDWFRVPSGHCPDGVTAHEWLALCEKNFASPLPASSAGSRFVRLCGAMHQLRYRPEVGAAPCLWRAELAA
jgi:hypothetical protein